MLPKVPIAIILFHRRSNHETPRSVGLSPCPEVILAWCYYYWCPCSEIFYSSLLSAIASPGMHHYSHISQEQQPWDPQEHQSEPLSQSHPGLVLHVLLVSVMRNLPLLSALTTPKYPSPWHYFTGGAIIWPPGASVRAPTLKLAWPGATITCAYAQKFSILPCYWPLPLQICITIIISLFHRSSNHENPRSVS